MVLRQGQLHIKPGPDGYSFQIMPNDGHIEFHADDVAKVKRVVAKPHTEVEIVCDLPTPNLPGMGLKHSTYEVVQNCKTINNPFSDILSTRTCLNCSAPLLLILWC